MHIAVLLIVSNIYFPSGNNAPASEVSSDVPKSDPSPKKNTAMPSNQCSPAEGDGKDINEVPYQNE